MHQGSCDVFEFSLETAFSKILTSKVLCGMAALDSGYKKKEIRSSSSLGYFGRLVVSDNLKQVRRIRDLFCIL